MKKNVLASLIIATTFISNIALSADHTAHNTHQNKLQQSCYENKLPFIQEFNISMDKMHTDMSAYKNAKAQDEAFIRSMIPHHQGAIDMAKTLKKYSQDSELLKLADEIIAAQQQEIAFMNNLLATLKDDTKDNITKAQAEYAQADALMHEQMMNYCAAKDVDTAFLQGMIPHHQGAIDMAKIYLKYGKNAQLIKLCNDIINSQSQEITFMQAKLAKN